MAHGTFLTEVGIARLGGEDTRAAHTRARCAHLITIDSTEDCRCGSRCLRGRIRLSEVDSRAELLSQADLLWAIVFEVKAAHFVFRVAIQRVSVRISDIVVDRTSTLGPPILHVVLQHRVYGVTRELSCCLRHYVELFSRHLVRRIILLSDQLLDHEGFRNNFHFGNASDVVLVE